MTCSACECPVPLEDRDVGSPNAEVKAVADLLTWVLRTKCRFSAGLADILDSRANSAAWTLWVVEGLLS